MLTLKKKITTKLETLMPEEQLISSIMCIAVSEVCCGQSLQSYKTSTYVSPTFFKQKACKWFTVNTTKGQTVLFCTVKVQLDWSYIWLKEICHF